jgi:O-antigen ligase
VRSGVIAFGAVAGLGAANGGFFPDSWGPAIVLLAWAAAMLLLLERPATFPRRGFAFGALACAVAGWTALSATWSSSVTSSTLEAERALVVVAAVLALLLTRDRAWMLRGIVAGVVVLAVWNLLARGGAYTGDEAVPVGYVNALGALTAVAIPLALRERVTWPALLVLVPELVLSGSRGAYVALALALVVGLVRRPALAIPAAALVFLLARHDSAGPRHEYYRVAFEQARSAPVLGTGAGTFDRWWLEHRPTPNSALDAHSVYLETLAEQGLTGLALLLALLATPLLTRPRDRLVLAAYAAFLIHAAVDWDLEMTALWLAGIAVGVALLPAQRVRLGRRRTASLAAATLALGALGTLSGVAQLSLARASDAARTRDFSRAGTLARRAARLEPWSSRPLEVLGEAQLAAGADAAAGATFRRAVAKDPSRWRLWHDLAEATGSDRAGREAKRLNPLGP